MTKKAKPTEITHDRIEEIKSVMEAIMQSSFEDIDKGIAMFWRDIIEAYSYWIITKEQKEKLKEYKEYAKHISQKDPEENIMSRMKIIENCEEPVLIYQLWMLDWRIVVASTKTVMEWREEKEKANLWIIIEIYKSETPIAYEYARKNYQIYQKTS